MHFKMLFIMNVGQGTNRPEGWVRTNRDSVRIVYIWVRNVWVRTCRGYETTGYPRDNATASYY